MPHLDMHPPRVGRSDATDSIHHAAQGTDLGGSGGPLCHHARESWGVALRLAGGRCACRAAMRGDNGSAAQEQVLQAGTAGCNCLDPQHKM